MQFLVTSHKSASLLDFLVKEALLVPFDVKALIRAEQQLSFMEHIQCYFPELAEGQRKLDGGGAQATVGKPIC